MRKIIISASSMPAGRNMSSQLEYISRVGNYGADMYHLDVMDRTYTKNKTIDYSYLEQLKEKSVLLFDVHLMIDNPGKVLKKYIKAGADIITLHYEVFKEQDKLISLLKKIKENKVMTGLAIDLDTDVKVIEPLLKYLDLVLIMSVKAGKGGQEFQKSALKKIKHIRTINKEILIEVDGGINDESAAACVKAGADILVSGSYIYNNDTYEAIQKLKGKNG